MSAAESTGNLMHGPKTESFAFHISHAKGSDVYEGKHHVRPGALKHKRAKKHNAVAKVNEDQDEKTW